MPIKILGPAARRDIIAYLKEESHGAAPAPSNASIAQTER